MAHSTAEVEVLRFNNERLPAAARTLSLSFSEDPLISWLYRLHARPWGDLDPLNELWQLRRIEWCATAFIVAAASQDTQKHSRECLAMMILKPPISPKWSLWLRPSRWMDVVKILLLGWLQKTEEQSIEKRRALQMFAAHEHMMRKHVPNRNRCWYLEVIAVRPDSQGYGLGGKLMRWMLSTIPDTEDCILECTDESNVAFYERYGFKLLEVTELKDEAEADRVVKEFIMMRPGQDRTTG